ncbi:deaminase domain-containing protein [Massilia sp.]|uniref:deaminase domain-containing protein n=1 Tax=Massilia sp. TaxID=1882437 RepID=UPI0028A23355|nr:deaminase domain-containing protein [Massilia sp.]
MSKIREDLSSLVLEIDNQLKHAHFKALALICIRALDDMQMQEMRNNGATETVALSKIVGSRADQIVGQSFFKESWHFRLDPEFKNRMADFILAGGTKPKGKIEGNIGFLNFIQDGKRSWGANIVGASFLAQKWDLGRCEYELASVDRNHVRFGATGEKKDNDSEYLLLNMLDQTLLKDLGREQSGVVELFTERHPCSSCANVIKSFLDMYPQIKMTILYALDGDTDDEASLKHILATSPAGHRLVKVRFEKLSSDSTEAGAN